MKFWVGITDREWFEFLSVREPDEVNFWQPSEKPLASFLSAGSPFLFKLHHPENFIVGGGFFVRFTSLPVWLAWSAFGPKNGVPDQAQLISRLLKYRRGSDARTAIGCNVLAQPFFFPREHWISVPTDWQINIVRGKTYDTESPLGHALWTDVQDRLDRTSSSMPVGEVEPRYGDSFLARARLGQGAFRVLVTDAYKRRCAITGERTLPALEAAHIQAYADSGPHLASNGLLLRSDLHRLFDEHYLTITPDLRVAVSRRIREEFENGREYYRLHGHELAQLPDAEKDRPGKAYLQWHNERFAG